MVSGIWHYRGAARLGAVAAILALAGCSSVNPVHWYKHLVRHKPDASATAPVTQTAPDANAEEPYPSLATVPPPSTFGLTDAQRAGLAEGLVADRQHAKYVEQEADAADAVPMPPPPEAAPPAPVMPDMAAPDVVSPADSVAPPPLPVKKVRAKKKVGASAVEKSLAASGLSSGGPFDQSSTAPAPRESPEPDEAAPAPDAPSLPPVPVAPPSAAAPAAAQAADAAVPDAPALAAAPSEKSAAVAKSAVDGVPVVVTAIHFASGSTSLPADAATNLKQVAATVAKSGGKVHVVSHAASLDDATASLAAYQAALARAKAVKQGLIAAGVADASIATEVSSSLSNEANDTAEVLVGK